MGWSGNGQVVRTDGVRTGSQVFQDQLAAGVAVRADLLDAHENDLATAIQASMPRNGEAPATGNWPMGGNRLTGLGSGTARTDSVNLGQAQDGGFQWAGTAGGTANELTVSVTPAITAYVNGQTKIRFVVGTTNTAGTALTINVNGVGSVALESRVGAYPLARSLVAGAVIEAVYISTTPGFVITSGLLIPPAYPRGYIDGFVISNSEVDAAHDIVIGPGVARSEYTEGPQGQGNIDSAAALTKRIDAPWAVGTDQGGLDTGSVAPDSWYALYAISRPSLASPTDFIFSLSDDPADSLPADYQLSRRIGWVLTDGSANILPFVQKPGGTVLWTDPTMDVDLDNTVGDEATLATLKAPPNTLAHVNVQISDGSNLLFYMNEVAVDSEIPVADGQPLPTFAIVTTGVVHPFPHSVWVDASSQIRLMASADAINSVRIMTRGYTDPRGRNA